MIANAAPGGIARCAWWTCQRAGLPSVLPVAQKWHWRPVRAFAARP